MAETETTETMAPPSAYEAMAQRLRERAAEILPDLALTMTADDHSLKIDGPDWAILLQRVGGIHFVTFGGPFAAEPAWLAVFQLLIFVDAVRRGEYPGQPGDWSV